MYSTSTLVLTVPGLPLTPRSIQRYRKCKLPPLLFEVWYNEPDGIDHKVHRNLWSAVKDPKNIDIEFVPYHQLKRAFTKCVVCDRFMYKAPAMHANQPRPGIAHFECHDLISTKGRLDRMASALVHRRDVDRPGEFQFHEWAGSRDNTMETFWLKCDLDSWTKSKCKSEDSE